MSEAPVALASREVASPQVPERRIPTNKETEIRQLTTGSVSKVITGSVNADASRFDPSNTAALTKEEEERIPTKGPQNLAYDKANILSCESRADVTTTYKDWFADFKRWAIHQTLDETFLQDGREAAFQAIGLLDIKTSQDGKVQYAVNVGGLYDRYLNGKADIKGFVEDLAAICKDEGADTINLSRFQEILTVVEPIFKVFGEKNRADLMVRDFAIAHGLLSQTTETKKILVEQIGQMITTSMPEDAGERKFLDKLAKIAARPATTPVPTEQPDTPPVVQTETTSEQQVISKSPKVDFGHGEVQVFRVTPQTREGDGTSESKMPLLFVHGHGQDKNLLSKLRQFAAAGKDVFGAAFVGRRKSIKWWPRRREDIGAKAPGYQVDKADDMVAAMEEIGVAQADVVATSEGALRTMIAVAKHPEKFQDIILAHPAGMDNKGGVRTHVRVATHYAINAAKHPARYLGYAHKFISRMFNKQPAEVEISGSWWRKALTTEAERLTVALSKFHEQAAALQKAHPHLRFLIIADKEDLIYPPSRLEKVNPTIPVVTSKWGGHGIRDQQSVIEIVEYLQKMKQTRQQAEMN